MMLSAGNGFIMQSEKYSRDNAGQSLKKYILLKKGELAYNHGASKAKQYGCCYELTEDEARIPYVYHCFKVSGAEHTPYVATALNNPKIDRQLKRLVSSSVRMDGLLNISFDDYMSVILHLPSLKEQTHIADFLKKLDERITAQEKLVASLKKYKRGLSKAVFSTNSELFPKSTVASLGELFPFIRNGFVGTVTPFFTSQENGVRYLQGTNIHDGKISDETAFYVTQAFNQKHSKNILKSNDILVVQSGHVGECAVVGDNYAGSNCHALIIMSNGGECASDYICQYINSDDGKKKIAAITTGNTIKHILATSIANIEVPLPSKKDQQRIAELLNSWDNRIEQEIRNLCKLVRIKEGLLQQLFI
jgi:restriction endonuclease S subunit